jgi:hypothetical protein
MRERRNSTHNHARFTRVLLGLVVLAFLALPLSAGGGNGDDAYTMWGIFHHDFMGPDDTLTVAYLTGQRVQSNGRAAFGASYAEGSDIGAFIPPGAPDALGPGLHDAVADIVVLVFRTHGRYDGRDEQIITGEFSGCPDCDDVQWACFLPGEEGPVDVHRGTDFCGSGPVVRRARATLDREAGVGIFVAAHTRLP